MIVVVGVVAAAGCAHPVEETLQGVRQAEALPVPLRLVYDERSTVLGGQRIEVDRDGVLVRRRWRPGFAPAQGDPEALLGEEPVEPGQADLVTRVQLPIEALRELAELLVELEAWDQRAEEDELGRVEDSRTVLVIRVDEGQSRIWEYSQDRARLERVKLALEGLVSRHSGSVGGVSPLGAEDPALVEAPDQR